MTTEVIDAPSYDLVEVGAMDIATEIDVQGMHAAMTAMRQFVAGELKERVHYGSVPGVPKKFLWLPGAEQIMRGFNCRPEYVTVQQVIDPNSGYFMFWRKCRAINIGTGKCVGEADAICTSDEFTDRNGAPLPFDKALPNGLMRADKRAMVKVARTLGCTSEFFTQDEELVLPSGGGTPSQPGIAPAAQPNLEGTAVGWCEVGTDGQWWINCQNHGPSKAKHWPANNRGPENVACSRKDGANWCRYRVNMSAVQQMHAQRVTPVQEEPPPSDDYPQYQYDDED